MRHILHEMSDQEEAGYSLSDFPCGEPEQKYLLCAVKSIDKSWQFVRDMMQMFHDGSFNDVCIKLHDGEIKANKSVLAARCEYFAATFRWKSNNNHDAEEIVVSDCSKKIMTRIIKYLFSGVLKIDDLSLLELLQLRDQVRKMLPGEDLEEFLLEYVYNPGPLTKMFQDYYFFPDDEEIVKTLSLVESGNLQMFDPEEICDILLLSKNCKKKILTLASFVYHGLLQEVSELVLCSYDSGFGSYHTPQIDLGFVPKEHLQALVLSVQKSIKIINVTGYDVVSLLDSVKSTKLHLTQKLNQEETDALVRAMTSRIDDVYLGGAGVISLDVDKLTQYKGDGKCRAIHCFWNRKILYQESVEWIDAERIEQWARKMNWSVSKYMCRGVGNEIYKMYLKRTKDLNDVQAVDYDLSILNLNN